MSSKTYVAVAIAVAIAAAVLIWRARTAFPSPGDPVYEQTTRAFYHGLAALEVGLLDDARDQFARATQLVEREPASWVNLGVTELRRGELDAAAVPIERALALAPDSSDVVLTAGRMEIARGRLDEGIAYLRRAVELDPDGLRARFALAEEVARSGTATAADDAQAILDDLAQLAPDNVAVLVERARVAATRRDAGRLRDSVTRLESHAAAWPPNVLEQYTVLRRAVDAGTFDDAARLTAPLRNVLASVPAFREDLAAVRTPTELIAEPMQRFVALDAPSPTPAPADQTLTFSSEPFTGAATAGSPPQAAVAFPLAVDGATAVWAADASAAYRVDAAGGSWPFASDRPPSAYGIVPIDWNNDFRNDVVLAGAGGLRLLLQGEDGVFTDATPQASSAGGVLPCVCFGAWAADVEMDGDLDLVAAPIEGGPIVVRNNGDGTWQPVPMFDGPMNVRGFVWADLDQDADPDALFLDASGVLHLFTNRQAGQFARAGGLDAGSIAAVTAADIDADGAFEIVTLGLDGVVRRMSREGARWTAVEIATWEGLARSQPGAHRLIAADLDNNGALDLVAAGAGESRIWLADESYRLTRLQTSPEGEVFSVVDLNGDGRLDFVGTAAGRAVRILGNGRAAYHWKAVRARAQQNAGDQRINPFGVGGQVEVRSGLLFQKHLLTGVPVHVGLGRHSGIDVARIVWPNGVPQAEFGIGVDDTIVADQRLKGSCPWVFAWDGTRMRFVTDFLWRSPLGLRINAQDTAGISQTEDWVKIAGDALVPHNGSYDVRITAELWETHFFDHVALMAVDHPAGTEIYVDERFSPAGPPVMAVRAFDTPKPIRRARDERGRDVTSAVASRDGEYLASFDRGRFQGVAADHWVEFEPAPGAGRGVTLVASGWIYPTDSSINVAIAQGRHAQPRGLSLEAQRADGTWVVVHRDLGFPAGKNKTILIDLSGTQDAQRLRLRTNLEIYWDWLATASEMETEPLTARVEASRAELRYRGFSETRSPRGEAPETPEYDRLAGIGQRWRDLEGFHTRFGDVRELVSAVDDRYVIMNAGDELQLSFPELPPVGPGWRRDFVLVGDGWEKDGDYNTGYSQTVLPLPSHDNPAYRAASEPPTLESDPVYLRHRADWERFHTRYVAPDAFVQGLQRRHSVTTHRGTERR